MFVNKIMKYSEFKTVFDYDFCNKIRINKTKR